MCYLASPLITHTHHSVYSDRHPKLQPYCDSLALTLGFHLTYYTWYGYYMRFPAAESKNLFFFPVGVKNVCLGTLTGNILRNEALTNQGFLSLTQQKGYWIVSACQTLLCCCWYTGLQDIDSLQHEVIMVSFMKCWYSSALQSEQTGCQRKKDLSTIKAKWIYMSSE